MARVIIRRIKLTTIEEVHNELAKVYKEARSGLIKSEDLGRFANCLQIISRVIEGGEIERRLEQLEATK